MASPVAASAARRGSAQEAALALPPLAETAEADLAVPSVAQPAAPQSPMLAELAEVWH